MKALIDDVKTLAFQLATLVAFLIAGAAGIVAALAFTYGDTGTAAQSVAVSGLAVTLAVVFSRNA